MSLYRGCETVIGVGFPKVHAEPNPFLKPTFEKNAHKSWSQSFPAPLRSQESISDFS